jgi:hypothetical protein
MNKHSDAPVHWGKGAVTMARRYFITIEEQLDESWSSWFDGLSITHGADGTTTLEGSIRDQSALYGLIDKARDLGLTLLAVGQAAPPRLTDEPTARTFPA